MKKNIIALLCAVCLLAAIFTGCARAGGGSSSNPAASGTDVSEPVIPDTPPSKLPEPEYGEKKDFEVSIEGGKEKVTMTYTKLEYLKEDTGLSDLAIYIDTERYVCVSSEGDYKIVPVDSGDNPVALIRLAQYVGQSAAEVVARAKEQAKEQKEEILDEGERKLDNYTAQYLETAAARAYYIEYEGGCLLVGIGLFSAEAQEGHAARLDAIARTIKIL